METSEWIFNQSVHLTGHFYTDKNNNQKIEQLF